MSAIEQEIRVNGKLMVAHFVPGYTEERNLLYDQKVVPKEELAGWGEALKRRHRKKVFTTGAYDVIHLGHIRYLQLAASLGDDLMVGLNSDSSVRTYKGEGRPVQEETERAELLCGLTCVGFITIFDELTGAETIRLFRPDVYLCVEGSWEGDLGSKEEVIAMEEVGGEVWCCPRQGPTISTTAIIERIERKYGERIMGDFKQLIQGDKHE